MELPNKRVNGPSGSVKRVCHWCSTHRLTALMVVMAIISIMISIAVPVYQRSQIRTKESVLTKESILKNNVFALRTVIDEYTFDRRKPRRRCRI